MSINCRAKQVELSRLVLRAVNSKRRRSNPTKFVSVELFAREAIRVEYAWFLASNDVVGQLKALVEIRSHRRSTEVTTLTGLSRAGIQEQTAVGLTGVHGVSPVRPLAEQAQCVIRRRPPGLLTGMSGVPVIMERDLIVKC